ncbi:MAG TPA: ABC transporter permease [Hanamia sp.]|nr:ABC transporter permease [Hanamia sp.]
MFKNYFKNAWRNLTGNKFYSLINISGLAIGLTTAIILLLWVQNEKSYNKFNKDYQNIYQLSTHFTDNGKEVWTQVPGPLSVFAKSISQVKSVVRIVTDYDQVLSNRDHSKIFDGNTVAAVDSSFFSVFNYLLVKGSKEVFLPNNLSAILTQKTAAKLFGNEDPMGKSVIYNNDIFTVTGVLKDFPQNSSLQYDAIFPMSYYGQQFTLKGGNGEWKTIDTDLGNFTFETYVKLQPGADPVKTGKAFSSAYNKMRNADSDARFQLEKIADIHLVSADGNNTALRMVQIFMLIAILLLLIAGINYVNLCTARSLTRVKEVSIRKVVGAKKTQLFLQFVTETFLLFFIAIAFSIVLIFLLMPLYNEISGEILGFSLMDPAAWEVILISIGTTIVAASIYPALLLSSFNPIQSLKGKISAGMGTVLFRKILVVFQFAVSIILIVSTLVISHQMKFIRDKNLGYDKSYVLSIPLPNKAEDHIDAIKNQLRNQQGILNVSSSDIDNISNLQRSTGDISWSGKPDNFDMIITEARIDKDFIPTMKMTFKEGGNFTGEPSDSVHYILNETAVDQMNLKPPYIGQQISFHKNIGTITGVLRDFNFKSLKEEISPLIFSSRSTWGGQNFLYIRTTGKDARHTIIAAQTLYKKYAGDIPFNYNFVDKQFEHMYLSDKRAGLLFNLFAGLVIFISCLGLFGLVTYTARVRTKELSIRKVLGATVIQITALLSKDFLLLVCISIMIATPFAWFGMNKWLQSFAYRIHIAWWIFIVSGFTALLIALLTVSFQAIKAAIANPVKSLRSE